MQSLQSFKQGLCTFRFVDASGCTSANPVSCGQNGFPASHFGSSELPENRRVLRWEAVLCEEGTMMWPDQVPLEKAFLFWGV